MTQFEYIQATSGYVHCACWTCFDVTVGVGDVLCDPCEGASCDDCNECQRDDVNE